MAGTEPDLRKRARCPWCSGAVVKQPDADVGMCVGCWRFVVPYSEHLVKEPSIVRRGEQVRTSSTVQKARHAPGPEMKEYARVVREGEPCPECGERVIHYWESRCASCDAALSREEGDDSMFDRLGYGLYRKKAR